jgi:hypothetical protein
MSKKKKTVQSNKPQRKKTGIEKNPNSYLHERPKWRFCNCDKERWSLSACKNIYQDIICKLQNFETMTWADINSSNGGRTHGSNNHWIDITKLIPEAQHRLKELHLYEDSQHIYSLRLSGKERLFGMIEEGVFYIIWYDQNHEICPCVK